MAVMDTKVKSNSSVQKMVYGISHDMGAPLRAVVQFSQMLKNRVGDKLSEKENYWLQLIEESGCHAQKMIEALLIYSRLTTHRPADSQFSLSQPLKQALADLNNIIESKSAIIEISGDWPEYTGCEEQWVMYFNYIIHNAVHYQPKDTEHVPQISIQCLQTNKKIRISIDDNGIGVKENLFDVITTPFKRMQSEKDYSGTGMGLSYCDQIAELHGGEIRFEQSSLGGLSVIYIEE